MLYHVKGTDIEAATPGVLLNEIHQKLVTKYKAKAAASLGTGGSSADAKLLQTFLTNWKRFANTGTVKTNSPFTVAYFEQMQARFPQNIRRLFKFNTSGGFNFEKELSAFIYAVLEGHGYLSGLDIDTFMSQVMVGRGEGHGTSHVSFSQDMLANIEQMASEIVQHAGNVVEENIKIAQLKGQADAMKILNTKGLVSRQRKVDVSTKSIEFIIDTDLTFDTQTEKILSLLSRATITAKNYGTTHWLEQFRKDHGWDVDYINLGDANIFRSVLGMLMANGYGYDGELAVAIICAAYTMPDIVALTHFAHLKFIYELTGEGQVIKNELFEGNNADYLIWNDYTSDAIIVKSTAELVMDLFNNILESDLTTHVHLNYKMWRKRFARKGYSKSK